MSMWDDLQKTINSIPKSPLDGRVILIPADSFLRKVETDEFDENGEVIFRTESVLTVRHEFQWLLDECQRNCVDYILSEFTPAKDKHGKPLVYTMPKPKLGFIGDF